MHILLSAKFRTRDFASSTNLLADVRPETGVTLVRYALDEGEIGGRLKPLSSCVDPIQNAGLVVRWTTARHGNGG